jgi:hypothetical protein
MSIFGALSRKADTGFFSEKIMLRQQHDPEKWPPVFGKDHAPPKSSSVMTSFRVVIPL